MQLTLEQTTIEQRTYWLGTTTTGLAFVGRENGPADEWQHFFPTASSHVTPTADSPAARALSAYLQGRTTSFDLPLDLTHGTSFQRQVWRALQTIPYGQTTTYSALAQQIGRPTASRAVANAVGKNPLLIIVPCHRVLRKDHTLGGYRGGLPMKRRLLTLEKN